MNSKHNSSPDIPERLSKSSSLQDSRGKSSSSLKPKVEKISKIKIMLVYSQTLTILLLFLGCLYLNYKVSFSGLK